MDVKENNEFLPKPAIPHTHLTHLMRRHWHEDASGLIRIVNKCNLSPFVGELPPELRACVPNNQISRTFYEFSYKLNEFIHANIADLTNPETYRAYDLSNSIGKLFGTDCTLVCDNKDMHGSFSYVYFMAFGGLEHDFAVKVFYASAPDDRHGPLYEIPTAFAALHAEPKDNVDTYIACLGDVGQAWTLAQYIDDYNYKEREWMANKYAMFTTAFTEMRFGNIRNGLRIDFGYTAQTSYGNAPYRVRKLYRRIDHAHANRDINEFNEICNQQKSYVARRELKHALGLMCCALDLLEERICPNPVSKAIIARVR